MHFCITEWKLLTIRTCNEVIYQIDEHYQKTISWLFLEYFIEKIRNVSNIVGQYFCIWNILSCVTSWSLERLLEFEGTKTKYQNIKIVKLKMKYFEVKQCLFKPLFSFWKFRGFKLFAIFHMDTLSRSVKDEWVLAIN